MSREIHLVVPGSISRTTGGTIYDRRIMQELTNLDYRLVPHELDGSFPLVGGAEHEAADRCVAAMAPAAPVVIDGLALPAFEHCLERLPRQWIALVHHPLALEGGLSPDTAAALDARERRMLARAGRVIVTSRRTGRDVEAMGVAAEKIGVVEPGTDPRPEAPADGLPPTLLAVGALIPRKGYDVLFEALANLMDLDWRLVVVGDDTRDPAMTEEVRKIIEGAGMGGRITFAGEVDDERLATAYLAADLFVLPSGHEGYGMALAEAVAYGLPIVSTRAGAIPDTVPEGAGLLVPPDDVGALSHAIGRLLEDPALRQGLRDGARAARRRLPTWQDAAAAFALELEAVGR